MSLIEKSLQKKSYETTYNINITTSSTGRIRTPVSMTMKIAQKLYENGKITYMRTDSTFMSEDFVKDLKTKIQNEYGKEFFQKPNKKKVKGAQEAHECIRPTNLETELSDKYEECDKKLYES